MSLFPNFQSAPVGLEASESTLSKAVMNLSISLSVIVKVVHEGCDYHLREQRVVSRVERLPRRLLQESLGLLKFYRYHKPKPPDFPYVGMFFFEGVEAFEELFARRGAVFDHALLFDDVD